jgi:hypothetical protein
LEDVVIEVMVRGRLPTFCRLTKGDVRGERLICGASAAVTLAMKWKVGGKKGDTWPGTGCRTGKSGVLTPVRNIAPVALTAMAEACEVPGPPK